MFKLFREIRLTPFYIFIAIACSSSKNISYNNHNEQNEFTKTEEISIKTVETNIVLDEDSYIDLPKNLIFRDHNYLDNIKSVQCYRKGFDQSIPIISYGSKEKVILKFDDFNEEIKSFLKDSHLMCAYFQACFQQNSNWDNRFPNLA